jgi:DNA repair photolyase
MELAAPPIPRQSIQWIDAREVHTTSDGKPITWYVDEQVNSGNWKVEVIPADVVGLSRPITVFRSSRRTNLITYAWHGDLETFCPPMWWDLAIGSGACGLGCRSCFLMLTHRIKRDPLRHLLYDNLDDFSHAVEKWLKDTSRRHQHTMGIGIDRSDSLLYEGVTAHVRHMAAMFAKESSNPVGCRMILLTKSANTHYLAEIAPEHRRNVVVTFSLNPESVADLWEGKWQDGERITPSIRQRLEAARFAQDLGYEVRVRVDPILTPIGWQELYSEFVSEIAHLGISFRYWTLGTYREKNGQLDAWRDRWGLLPMEWEPDDLVSDGTHWHLPAERRIEIYGTLHKIIKRELPQARISLCKETHQVRKALMLCNADCNCLR